MDNNNWRAAQGQVQIPGQVIGGEAVAAGGLEGGDWRTQLQPESRQGIVNKIMETLKRHLPHSGQDGLQELKKIAVTFEEKIYTTAISQSDYLRKITLKMLTMETKSQNPMANSLPSNAANNNKNPQDPDFEDVNPFSSGPEEQFVDLEGRSFTLSTANQGKKRKQGPMNFFVSRSIDPSKVGRKEKQTMLDEARMKELKDKAYQSFTRWLYDAAIPFNAVNHESLKEVFMDIGRYGVGLEPPSYHEVRVPYLKKAVEHVNDDYVRNCEVEWAKYGCTLMVDGWIDRRQRTLINFLVNSPKGSVFIDCIDASSYSKTGEKMFELIDKFVERVGEKNVVQIVTDNASNMVAAGKLLEAKRPHLY